MGLNQNHYADLMQTAIAQKNKHTVLALLNENGIDIFSIDNQRWTALHNCVYYDDVATASGILFLKAHDVNITDQEGWTPLHVSVFEKQINAIKLLLNHKEININQRNKDGDTALHIAAKDNEFSVLKELLAAPNINIHLKSGPAYNRQTALEILLESANNALKGNEQNIRLLAQAYIKKGEFKALLNYVSNSVVKDVLHPYLLTSFYCTTRLKNQTLQSQGIIDHVNKLPAPMQALIFSKLINHNPNEQIFEKCFEFAHKHQDKIGERTYSTLKLSRS